MIWEKIPKLPPDSLATVEELLIKHYGARVNTLNKARYVLFCQKQATSESLLPTDDVLKFHDMRVNYQLSIWNRALVAKPTIPNGILEDDIFVPTLIEREPAPNTLVELTTCGCQKGCSRNCKCQKEDLPCTEACFCTCGADDDCRNPFSVQLIDENESHSKSDCDSDS